MNAQYSEASADSADSDTVEEAAYSRAELRALFLGLEDRPEITALARHSKTNYSWSAIANTAGALSSALALFYLHQMVGEENAWRVEPFLAIGAAVTCFSLGQWQLNKSKLRLRQARALYRERMGHWPKPEHR